MAGPAPINVVLLRGLLPDLTLKPGVLVSARVLDPATLVIAGVRMGAQLPAGVVAGQILRLRVAETSTERIHLQIVGGPLAGEPGEVPAQVPASAYQLALPGGAVARVHVEEREEAGGAGARRGAARSVVVRYDSPTLGRIDVRLDAASAAVHVSDGDPAVIVQASASRLGAALARAVGAPVQVTVHPRREMLDVRA
jgi:hypothetical protein